MLTRSAGVEISGIIGFPILRELVLSIDYRDNLVHFVYDPKKGFHAHNDNGASGELTDVADNIRVGLQSRPRGSALANPGRRG